MLQPLRDQAQRRACLWNLPGDVEEVLKPPARCRLEDWKWCQSGNSLAIVLFRVCKLAELGAYGGDPSRCLQSLLPGSAPARRFHVPIRIVVQCTDRPNTYLQTNSCATAKLECMVRGMSVICWRSGCRNCFRICGMVSDWSSVYKDH